MKLWCHTTVLYSLCKKVLEKVFSGILMTRVSFWMLFGCTVIKCADKVRENSLIILFFIFGMFSCPFLPHVEQSLYVLCYLGGLLTITVSYMSTPVFMWPYVKAVVTITGFNWCFFPWQVFLKLFLKWTYYPLYMESCFLGWMLLKLVVQDCFNKLSFPDHKEYNTNVQDTRNDRLVFKFSNWWKAGYLGKKHFFF